MATSHFMNEFYNGGLASELRLCHDYVYELRKQKAKLAERYM